MPLAITARTTIGDFSRQIGLQLVVLQFIISTSKKALFYVILVWESLIGATVSQFVPSGPAVCGVQGPTLK
jgi:hypothetical protein